VDSCPAAEQLDARVVGRDAGYERLPWSLYRALDLYGRVAVLGRSATPFSVPVTFSQSISNRGDDTGSVLLDDGGANP